MNRHVLCFATSVALSLGAFAQETNTRQQLTVEKKTETPPPEAAAALFPFHPINKWEGQRFVFLAGPQATQDSVYDDFSGKLTRKQYAGRIARVVAVSDFSGRVHLEFEMEDTKEKLRARTTPGSERLTGMALVDDIENARAQWQGRTFWCKENRLVTHDAQTGQVSYVVIKKYAPVKVLEVTAGWNEEKPVRFVLETADGKRGFIDLNLSGTNVFKDARYLHRFEHCLLTTDPRLQYKWPPQIWKLIEQGQIGAGMTAEQVKMSWGEPDKITRTATAEHWTYPGGTLAFKNNVLVGKQN